MINKKEEIRKVIKNKRELLESDIKNDLDNKIFHKIIEREEYKRAKTIFIYVSFGKEVDTHKFIKHALIDKKVICVPKVISKREGMKAVRIKSFEDLKEGLYGILEPKDFKDAIDNRNIDLVLLPGIAFDFNGGRVGYGGAFYDRFLKKISKDTIKIGLAYNFQVFKQVPIENHDIKINGIITN